MTRDQGLKLIKKSVKNKNLIKHMLATEVIMRKLAEKFEEDLEEWGLAGLIHDVDYQLTEATPEKHGLLGAEMLKELEVEESIIQAVKGHCDHVERTTLMDKALFACDPLTGLIVAAALIHPDKKLTSIDTDFIMKRFGEKSFARGANRDQIRSCSELNLSLEEFISLGLESMTDIAQDLGL